MALGWGDLLALAADFSYSAYILTAKRARDCLDTVSYQPSCVSVGPLGQPVVPAVLTFFLLGEGGTPLQVLGGVLIGAGIYLAATRRRGRLNSEERRFAYNSPARSSSSHSS